MSAIPRASRDVPAQEPVQSAGMFEDFVTLYQKGVECVAEIQNRTLDCALQHNKQSLELWKQAMEKLPWAPGMNVLENFAGTLERLAEGQKAAIGLAVGQSRALVEMVKERGTATGKTADSLSKFARQSFDRSVAAQKKMAEVAMAEGKAVFETARGPFVFPGTEAVIDSLRQGFDTVIDAQKEVLGAAASQWTAPPEPVAAS